MLLLCIYCFAVQVAELIRHAIDTYNKPIPAVLEIPSKDHPYDASKDSILRRAKVKNALFKCPFLTVVFFKGLMPYRIGNGLLYFECENVVFSQVTLPHAEFCYQQHALSTSACLISVCPIQYISAQDH